MRTTSIRSLCAIGIITVFVGMIAVTYFVSFPDPSTSQRYLAIRVEDTGASNRVSGIYLNVRLFDTLLEILVFSVAVLGVRYYLRHAADTDIPSLSESAVVRTSAGFLGPLALLLSAVFAIFGHVSPGGGFSSGVIAGSAILFVAIAQGIEKTEAKLNPARVATVEKLLLLLVLIWAIAPALFGLAPLSDMLPKGEAGQLLSGGSILPYNLVIGAKVFLGAWLIIAAFAQHRGEL